MKLLRVYLILTLGILALTVESSMVEPLENQKLLEINLSDKIQRLEDNLYQVNLVLKHLKQEINDKGLQQLQNKQSQLNQQQLELNRQWVDLKVLVEKALKQNKQLETIIFQELKQVTLSEAFLKENLLMLCKKVEALEHPPLLLVKLREYRLPVIGILIGLIGLWLVKKLCLFLKQRRRRISKKVDEQLNLPLDEQINLAKAYLELDDYDEARFILEKLVAQQQNETIRNEARAILNQLEK